MPNMAYNRLIVRGTPEALAAFSAAIDGESDDDGAPYVVDFERLLPMPPELLDDTPAEGFPASRTWRTEHWGTKWNAQSPTRAGRPGDGELIYTFDTAYDPPNEDMMRRFATLANVELTHDCLWEMESTGRRVVWRRGKIIATSEFDEADVDWIEWAEEED